MRNYEYGIASPQHNHLRRSLIRPKSQQPRTSLGQMRSPCKEIQDETPKQIFQSPSISQSPVTQYYINGSIPRNGSSRQINNSHRKGSFFVADGISERGWQKLRKYMSDKIQKSLYELRQQIFKQSGVIMHLQKTIQRQQKELQSKNSVIQSIIQQGNFNFQHKRYSFFINKLKDVQQKLKIISDQFIQEQESVNQKINKLTLQTIRNLGNRLQQARRGITNFINMNTNSLEECQSLKNSKNSIRNTQQSRNSHNMKKSSDRETCSSGNRSKESLLSEKPSKIRRGDYSVYSDYFFIPEPSEMETPTIKAIGEIVKEREQLPIKIYMDSSGKLKYWESRTYLFDRKGNFLDARTDEIEEMEGKGWIKLVKSQ